MAKREKSDDKEAAVIHVSMEHGEEHVVGIGNIRVFIVQDGKYMYAQGLEIDYASQGETVEEAKKSFEEGLAATIHNNLELHGTIAPILRIAPQDVWDEFFNKEVISHRYSQVSIHQIEAMKPMLSELPFQGIDYLEKATTP